MMTGPFIPLFLFYACLFLGVFALKAEGANYDHPGDDFWESESTHMLSFGALCMTQTFNFGILGTETEQKKPGNHFRNVKRRRRSVRDVFEELGEGNVRKAFRMDERDFFYLNEILRKHVHKKSRTKKHKNGGANGSIDSTVRLGAALRHFAGGSMYDDISVMFGIGITDVHKSIWMVVNAVHKCSALDITFPSDHDDQRKTAAEFQKKSRPGFDCCVGAVDGTLIWTERPSNKECKEAKCGAAEFFCGRKKNLDGTCKLFVMQRGDCLMQVCFILARHQTVLHLQLLL